MSHDLQPQPSLASRDRVLRRPLHLALVTLCFLLLPRAALGLPELVGEIFAGIVLGNLGLLGIDVDLSQQLRDSKFMNYAAEIGVVLLLFVVSLESSMRELLRVGINAVAVVLATTLIGPILLKPRLPHF